jgi:hypothetical protein
LEKYAPHLEKEKYSVEKVCIFKKKVVGGIKCMICSTKCHFSCTNTNKEINKKWICKSRMQITRTETLERCEIAKCVVW